MGESVSIYNERLDAYYWDTFQLPPTVSGLGLNEKLDPAPNVTGGEYGLPLPGFGLTKGITLRLAEQQGLLEGPVIEDNGEQQWQQ